MGQLGECLSWVVGTAWEPLWCFFLGGRVWLPRLACSLILCFASALSFHAPLLQGSPLLLYIHSGNFSHWITPCFPYKLVYPMYRQYSSPPWTWSYCIPAWQWQPKMNSINFIKISLQPAKSWPCGTKGPECHVSLSMCWGFYWEKHTLMKLMFHKNNSEGFRAFKGTKAEHPPEADDLPALSVYQLI